MSLEGVILSFVGEKWQNMSFIGKTRNSVPVSIKVVPIPMLPVALIFVPLHC